MTPIARALLALYLAALVLVPGFAILLGAPLGPWLWGTALVVVASLLALIGWAASAPKAPPDPHACTCGWHALSNGGPNDPACPVHGRNPIAPPAGSTGVTMDRTTDRRPE